MAIMLEISSLTKKIKKIQSTIDLYTREVLAKQQCELVVAAAAEKPTLDGDNKLARVG